MVKLSPWAYFLGLGIAIGGGSIGTLLNIFMHNLALSYSIGLIIGLLLGSLGVKFLGEQFIVQFQKQQARTRTVQTEKRPLPLVFFIGMGIALGSASLGTPLSLALHNPVLGVSLGISFGLVIGIIVGQIVRMTRK